MPPPDDDKKPDEKPADPPPPAAPSEDVKSLTSAVSSLVGTIKEMQAAGDTRVVERAAAASGIDEATLTKMIEDSVATGETSKGVVKAIRAIQAETSNATLAALGMQKVDLLAVHPEHGAAFAKHGQGFRKFIRESGLNIAGFAATNPATSRPYSEEIFQHYLMTQTKWYDEQASSRELKAREDERKKVETEFAQRTGRPASPSLSPGAAPEGGSLRDSIRRANEAAGELTEVQLDRAKRLGATDEDIKIVSQSRAARTASGTPILAIPTSNEGSR